MNKKKIIAFVLTMALLIASIVMLCLSVPNDVNAADTAMAMVTLR